MSMQREWIENIPEKLAQSYLTLEEEILADICRRFAVSGTATASALHQIRQLQQQGISLIEIERAIKRTLGITQKQLEDMFDEAVEREQAYATQLLEKASITKPVVGGQALLLEEVEAVKKQTKEQLYNITQSLGFSIKINGKTQFYPIAETYQKVLDIAYLEVSTGTLDYNTAIKNAVKKLTDSGIRYVYYDKEGKRWTNHVDVAVERAVRTATSQMSGIIAENTMQMLDTPYVIVSAHSTARTGKGLKGIADHASWQGKVYFWKEKSKTGENPYHYPDFVKTTGYGKGEGLKGYNCSHVFSAFIPGVSKREYTDKQLKEMTEKTFTYKGKTYTPYDATQYMRKLERDMRKLKRNMIGYQAMGGAEGEKAFENAAIKLQMKSRAYHSFSKVSKLKKRQSSAQVYGFDRSLAAKAKKYYAPKGYQYKKDGVIKVTEDWKEKGKVTIPKKYKPFSVIESQTEYKDGTIQIDTTLYDKKGLLKKQIHSGNHKKPKQHKFGENADEAYHAHDYQWNEDGTLKNRVSRAWNEKERKEHKDLLEGM